MTHRVTYRTKFARTFLSARLQNPLQDSRPGHRVARGIGNAIHLQPQMSTSFVGLGSLLRPVAIRIPRGRRPFNHGLRPCNSLISADLRTRNEFYQRCGFTLDWIWTCGALRQSRAPTPPAVPTVRCDLLSFLIPDGISRCVEARRLILLPQNN